MKTKIKHTAFFLGNKVILPVTVAALVGLTTNFMRNFSDSPDLKLLIPGNMSEVQPDLRGKYKVTLSLENRGAAVTSSRVKIKVPKTPEGAITVNTVEKQLAVGDALMVEKGFEKVSENARETVYQRDIEFKVFPNRNYDLGTIEVDFSKDPEPRFEYNIVAESMVKRVGYYVFNLSDGKIGIKEGRQWADRESMNAKGWGKFFRYVSGKNIR